MADKSNPVGELVGVPQDQRAIQLQPYLNRTIPYWGHPGYFAGAQWRSVVRNQPVSIICRDTLISNMLSAEWSVRLREPEETKLQASKDEIDHYTKVFTEADGDFDDHIALIVQDMLDLPFGGMCEVGRNPDEPEGKTEWIEHVDGATLVPTGDRNWPVVQSVPDVPHRPVVFPKHAISRIFVSPSPNIRRKGWGMAPPEKIYLALQMLYRGDVYYANLLLDTPEAGILDLADMSQESAKEWLAGFKSLFSGIDGFKVPVLYEHEKPAQWIPFNRPPTDMLYDEVTMRYAQLVAAGYGLRMSDIGLAEVAGSKTLAGVIREERQSRRTGQAEVKSRIENYFNRILPDHLKFVWEEKDEEVKKAQAQALSTYGLALGQLKRDGLLTPEESRMELVSTGLLETEIDPTIVPEPEGMMQQGGVPMQGGGQPQGKGKGILGKFGGGPKQTGRPSDAERGKVSKQERGKVSAAQGGRGGPVARTIEVLPENKYDASFVSMTNIVKPALNALPELAVLHSPRNAARGDFQNQAPRAPRLRRLIRPVLEAMLPQVQRTFQELDDDAILRFWLPEMQKVDFGQESKLDGLVTRQSAEELRAILDEQLATDFWWQTASAWDKAEILEIFIAAYEVGLEDQAILMVRALFEAGSISAPSFAPVVAFDLSNAHIITGLESAAAELVTNVNQGTKYFIKRILVASVREGLAQPITAQAVREGVAAAELLRRDGFAEPVIQEILSGLIEMSETRAQSIVHTELHRVVNEGALEQIKRSGLKTKKWQHLGPRGITEAGNEHPCPICSGNEELGFVDTDFLFKTVFKSGGPKDDGRAVGPPGHPNICHCTVVFDEDELVEQVKSGTYNPYTGD